MVARHLLSSERCPWGKSMGLSHLCEWHLPTRSGVWRQNGANGTATFMVGLLMNTFWALCLSGSSQVIWIAFKESPSLTKVEPLSPQGSWGASFEMGHGLFIRRAAERGQSSQMPFPKPAARGAGLLPGAALPIPRGAAEWLTATPALVLPGSSPKAGFDENPLASPGPLEIPGRALGANSILPPQLQCPPISSLPLAPKL